MLWARVGALVGLGVLGSRTKNRPDLHTRARTVTQLAHGPRVGTRVSALGPGPTALDLPRRTGPGHEH